MHDRLVMVKYHDDRRNHKRTLLYCDLFPMLKRYLASEKYIPANEQLLFSDACVLSDRYADFNRPCC